MKLHATHPAIFDRMSALAEMCRGRILFLLDGREMTVSELCSVLQLPQSTVSRHLKALADEAWIVSRRDGTSGWYTLRAEDLPPDMRRLWDLVREEVSATPAAWQDQRRLATVLVTRQSRSKEYFATAAGEWDGLRDELFGSGFYLRSLPALLDRDWTVGDLGCGTGQLAESLAPFVRRVVAVDDSKAMIEAARSRLGRFENVDVKRATLESIPLPDGSLDAATLVLVLHHIPAPGSVLSEVARVLRPGGRLLVVDMLPHDRQEYRQAMGHVWLGFQEATMEHHLAEAGFVSPVIVPLPADPKAKGPALFAAAATTPRQTGLHDEAESAVSSSR